jgi:oxygen-independent coproporphyrinogen III oxidase
MHDLWQPVRFDRALVRKYDRPGPRYTSYPSAPHFRDDFGPAEYGDLLAASRASGLPLSLYVHLPFCAKRCFFCGCNVTIASNPASGRERSRRYLGLLEREMAAVAARLGGEEREAVQIHWGGGTPTFLTAAELTELMGLLRRNFRVAPRAEIGVEVDPRACSEEQLDALAHAGVNRISLGVQDLDPTVQRAVNRVQPPELTWGVLTGARQRGIRSINVDLIYGLPHQTPESFAATIREVLAMAPDRLAVFNFAYLPEAFKHQRAIDPAALPDPEVKLLLLEAAIADLTAAGYILIGMDHFARPEDPLAQALRERTLSRNFQGYATGGEVDLVALGASAIGKVAGGYAQNAKTDLAYGAAIEGRGFATCRGLRLSPEDHLRRDVIHRLMCDFRLDKAEVEKRHGIDFDRHFAAELEDLEPLAEDGLVELGAESLEVTPLGRLLVRNVAMAFDGYLAEAPAVRYSRTV